MQNDFRYQMLKLAIKMICNGLYLLKDSISYKIYTYNCALRKDKR